HKGVGWEIFTNNIIKELNKDNRPKVFVFWGNNAIAKKKLITNRKHLVITSSHPSPLSARHSFFGSHVFSRINTFLRKTKQKEIDFYIK
ncbi:MAG: uracil-DNA glycosylase, partial [Candidatus Izimaplasma sp.]|nr:uracil-DNA glycosylase [Candidatus Izimaplasma bacterium]